MTFPFVGTHTRRDWEAWERRNVGLTEEGASLTIAPLPAYVNPQPAIPEFPSGLTVADVDVDGCRDLYVLSQDGEVYRYDRSRRELRRLPCTWDVGVATPTGLRVTGDTIYVADAGSVVTDTEPPVPGSSPAPGATTPGAGGGTPAGDGRVHAISKHLLQTRWVETESFVSPVALAGEGDDVYVLDIGPADEDGSGDDGEDGDGSGSDTDDETSRHEGGFLVRIDRYARTEMEATELVAPSDAAVDREGNRYVLSVVEGETETGLAVTLYEDHEGGVRSEVLVPPGGFQTSGQVPFEPGCIEADHVGEVIVGVAPGDGGGRPLFRFRPAKRTFERLAGFSGRASGLCLARDWVTCDATSLYVVAGDGSTVTILTARPAHALNPDTGRYDGQLVARLDSGIEGVQWHRVTMALPPAAAGTEARVRYFATDDPDLDYQLRPGIDIEMLPGLGPTYGERLRDAGVDVLSELVALAPAMVARYAGTPTAPVTEAQATTWIQEAERLLAEQDHEELDWQSLGPPTPGDALLTDAVGRYLWVRLDLVGTQFETPTVSSLRAYFPRQSYLRYLPAIFREDEASAAFLEHFLSIFESVFTEVEEEIAAAIRYLDADGVPPEYLPWLGSWLALSADETWPTPAHRELLRRAPDLFRYRGTRAGLLETTRIFLDDRLDPPPRWASAMARQREAIEALRDAGRLTEAAAARAIDRLDPSPFVWEFGDLSCIDDKTVRAIYERLIPCKQCFALLLPPFVDEEPARTVARIVQSQAPAHAVGRTIELRPQFRLAGDEHDRGYHTYLGINSLLADRDFVVDESTLGGDTELVERESDGHLEVRSRLGTDTQLS